MKLSELRENPDNPSVATETEIDRLAGKLKRVPLGLTAQRIAYVTDTPEGGKMVISGNKRLHVLKKLYGENAELPDDYFQDVTAMSEAERHEFVITANVSDGEWDLDKLVEQYGAEEMEDYGLGQLVKFFDKDEEPTEHETSPNAKCDLEKVSVLIRCADDTEAEAIFNKLTAEGYVCELTTL